MNNQYEDLTNDELKVVEEYLEDELNNIRNELSERLYYDK